MCYEDDCECYMCSGSYDMAYGCTTCWEVMEPCPCGDSKCDLLYCSCRSAHVAANPPKDCECPQCPYKIPNDATFCGMCRKYTQIDVTSVQPAKVRVTCTYHLVVKET